MNVDKLKEYYIKIDKCTVTISKEVDFEYIQDKISRIAIFTEEISRIMGEILIEKTRLEHILTDKRFDYELRFTKHSTESETVKVFSSAKERQDYINYFLLREEYKEIKNLEQELKDVESLLGLAKKKSRDLDRTYPKLKILWDTISTELKYIKRLGSDSDHIEKVREEIEQVNVKAVPIFTDETAEEIKNVSQTENFITDKNSELENLDDLLKEI